MNIVFNGEELTLVKNTYAGSNSPALSFVDSEGMPYMTASVNVPEILIDDDCTFIKNYSENEGILDVLIEAGIVKDLDYSVKSGFVELPLVEVLV